MRPTGRIRGLARLLKVDLSSRLQCDLKTLLKWDTIPKGVWMVPARIPSRDHRSGERRVFEIYNAGEFQEGLEPLYRDYDGERLGVERDTERDVHLTFCMTGRITGRFADREWWTSTRTYYRTQVMRAMTQTQAEGRVADVFPPPFCPRRRQSWDVSIHAGN